MSDDIALQLGIVVHAHLAADLGVGLLADRDFLRLAHERDLALAGDGIGGARREKKTSEPRNGRAADVWRGRLARARFVMMVSSTRLPTGGGRESSRGRSVLQLAYHESRARTPCQTVRTGVSFSA